MGSEYFWNFENHKILFFSDIDYRTGWEMYLDAVPYLKDFEPPGVEVHCLYGYGIPTVEKWDDFSNNTSITRSVFFHLSAFSRLHYSEGKFPAQPTLVTGDGDGTVNLRSLQSCNKWKTKQKQPIYEYPMKNIDHMSILRSVDTLEYIKYILEKL